MRKGTEEIIDAEWVDIPAKAPETARPAPQGRVARAKPIPKEKKPRRAANPEGRLDVLCGGILTNYYGQMTGTPAPANIAGAIQDAASMILGRQRARGPEWEFLKKLMGG